MHSAVGGAEMDRAEKKLLLGNPAPFLDRGRHHLDQQVRPREDFFRGKGDGSACVLVRLRGESAREPGLSLDDHGVARPGKGIGPRRREGDAALIRTASERALDELIIVWIRADRLI